MNKMRRGQEEEWKKDRVTRQCLKQLGLLTSTYAEHKYPILSSCTRFCIRLCVHISYSTLQDLKSIQTPVKRPMSFEL